MPNYKKTSTTELVELFAKAAVEQGEALRIGDPKRANSKYGILKKTYLELKARGSEAQREICSLFEHPDGYVRLNAAAHSLEFDTPGALRVLRILDKMESGLLGLTAAMIVKEWTKKQNAKARVGGT